MVSVICQCRNSWMHESPDVSPSPVSTPVEDPCYNYKRDHELSISISLPPFHPLVHEGEKRRNLSVQIARMHKDFLPSLIFPYRSNVINIP